MKVPAGVMAAEAIGEAGSKAPPGTVAAGATGSSTGLAAACGAAGSLRALAAGLADKACLAAGPTFYLAIIMRAEAAHAHKNWRALTTRLLIATIVVG